MGDDWSVENIFMSELSLSHPTKVGLLMMWRLSWWIYCLYQFTPPSSIGSQRDMSNQEKGLEINELDFELLKENLGAQIDIQRS